MITYIVNIVITIAYMSILTSIISESGVSKVYGEPYQVGTDVYTPYVDLRTLTNSFSTFTSVIATASFAIYNFRYFKERDELFIH